MLDNADVLELTSILLVGITVGVGSQVLVFENGSSISFQCPFKCIRDDGSVRLGHGEHKESSVLIFDLLNQRTKRVLVDEGGTLCLEFSSGKLILIPEANGLESYVVNTRLGVCPVSVY